MKQVDRTEWERLKHHAAIHLESRFWQSGTFCVIPAAPGIAPEVWVTHVEESRIHIIR
ncbi:MAG: hypothetical protein KKH51_16175 [Actinobacteria bacterium]|nr:hypothetical protein [Actinomycetota bacterium]